MKIGKMAAIVSVIIVLFSGGFLFCIHGLQIEKTDTVIVNEIVNICVNHWNDKDFSKLPDYDIEFAIVDESETLLYQTAQSKIKNLNEALQNQALIVDIKDASGRMLGKVLFDNPMKKQISDIKQQLLFLGILFSALVLALAVGYLLYLNGKILKPFAQLQEFSANIARGNFDAPLRMDKQNIFGAFTESFDIMREELLRARENERQANQSKKELVASLSHDIKTPVSSIIALSEVMIVKSDSKEEQEKLRTILTKAEQINALISNMFHATLEELQTLSVSPTELSGKELLAMMEKADYENRIELHCLPECIVLCDALRIQQVFDNIIGNAYKYANTDIEVKGELLENQLEISFKDFGKGMVEEELPLIFGKFYRGENAVGKNGAGLGLYISHYVMTKMGGSISAENAEDGFIVRIRLNLA